MIKKKYRFNGEDGFHARPVTEFVKIAKGFESKAEIIFNDETFDGKSPLSIMSACIEDGREFQIVLDGADEEEAFSALEGKMRFEEQYFCPAEGDAPVENDTEAQETKTSQSTDAYLTISTGCSIGTAQVIKRHRFTDVRQETTIPEKEIARLEEAIESLKKKLEHSAERAPDKNLKEILGAHSEILLDAHFVQAVKDQINNENKSCLAAIDFASGEYQNKFLALDNERMRARAADIKDVSAQLINEITGEGIELVIREKGTILVADEILPSDTVKLDKNMVSGFITQTGGKNCHSAIIARSMGIPAISNVTNAAEIIHDGDVLILDAGEQGTVIINPDRDQLEHYRSKISERLKESLENEKYKNVPTKTLDGYEMELAANIFDASKLQSAVESGAQGVGLFRTEFLYMNRLTPPTLEEQFECYKALLQEAKGLPITIRTLDAGGDKPTPCLKMPKEDNPFLGVRAIRFCLRNEDIFNTQLKALLMASAYGNLRIMFPMITTCEELSRTLELLNEQKRILEEQGIGIGNYSVGIMIETPSAVIMSRELAKMVDFFSIGTNDLTQYTMAADRGSTDLSELNSACQPSVLRSIYYVVKTAEDAGIWVGVCGESGSDPLLAPLYLGMGISELSMNESSIAPIRRIINNSNRKELAKKCDFVLSMPTAGEVHKALKEL